MIIVRNYTDRKHEFFNGKLEGNKQQTFYSLHISYLLIVVGILIPSNCLVTKLFFASNFSKCIFCEAQGKGRAKGRPRKVTQRSFSDGGWWMVVILSLMLYIKFGCHPPTFHPYFSKSPGLS